MTQDDPVDRWFETLRQEQPAPAADAGLERRLVREMREFPSRRRRLRLVVAVTLLALFALGGGVHAAGGLRAIRGWFENVRLIEIRMEPGGEPRVLLRDESGNVIGTGRLPPPDENGDYRAHILPDK
ncbi:MAG TPA: hypothetical protein VG125_23255 [Pirellulales bacterium]|jgi:hypothetical protein|nr:hypothetical protein [Pirellulales bacterium]